MTSLSIIQDFNSKNKLNKANKRAKLKAFQQLNGLLVNLLQMISVIV